jgi:hypothetical protein
VDGKIDFQRVGRRIVAPRREIAAERVGRASVMRIMWAAIFSADLIVSVRRRG